MKFFFNIVRETPSYKTILILQLLSSSLTFVGIPLLIPLIQSAQSSLNNVPIPNEAIQTIVNIIGITPTFNNLLMLVFIVFITAEGVKLISNIIAANARLKLVIRRRKRILENYLYTKWQFLNTDKSGDMNDSIIRQADLSAFVHLNAIRLISWLIQFITYLILALLISYEATFLALIVYSFITVLNYINSIGFKKKSSIFHNLSLKLSILVSDFQKNRKQYKSTSEFSLYKPIDKVIDQSAKAYLNMTIREEGQGYWIHILGFGFLVLLLAFYDVFALNFSQLIVLVLVFQRLSPAYQGTQKGYLDFRRDIPAYHLIDNRINEIINNKEQNGDIDIDAFSTIKFDNVTFSYSRDDNVLEDISFKINPRQSIAIVGESGSGKSTILDLITGLLRPNNGEIYFGGHPSNEINFTNFRKNISYVGQEVTILDGTILDNILIGVNQNEREALIPKVKEALQKVNLHSLLDNNSVGLNYNVGENGSNLSGGQIQRLLMARALYREPSLLILDEATSSLDTRTDKHIYETLNAIKGETTIILVTHRLNNLHLADNIIFLNQGRIIESGNLDKLIKQRGEFSVLYNSQNLENS